MAGKLTTLANYAVFKNPYHCDECGWNRQPTLMTREQARIASKLNRALSPQHGWIARKVGRLALSEGKEAGTNG